MVGRKMTFVAVSVRCPFYLIRIILGVELVCMYTLKKIFFNRVDLQCCAKSTCAFTQLVSSVGERIHLCRWNLFSMQMGVEDCFIYAWCGMMGRCDNDI